MNTVKIIKNFKINKLNSGGSDFYQVVKGGEIVKQSDDLKSCVELVLSKTENARYKKGDFLSGLTKNTAKKKGFSFNQSVETIEDEKIEFLDICSDSYDYEFLCTYHSVKGIDGWILQSSVMPSEIVDLLPTKIEDEKELRKVIKMLEKADAHNCLD